MICSMISRSTLSLSDVEAAEIPDRLDSPSMRQLKHERGKGEWNQNKNHTGFQDYHDA